MDREEGVVREKTAEANIGRFPARAKVKHVRVDYEEEEEEGFQGEVDFIDLITEVDSLESEKTATSELRIPEHLAYDVKEVLDEILP